MYALDGAPLSANAEWILKNLSRTFKRDGFEIQTGRLIVLDKLTNETRVIDYIGDGWHELVHIKG